MRLFAEITNDCVRRVGFDRTLQYRIESQDISLFARDSAGKIESSLVRDVGITLSMCVCVFCAMRMPACLTLHRKYDLRIRSLAADR